MALHTGLCRGELLALRWDDIDFEKGTLRVDQSLDQHGAFHAPKREESRRTLRLTPVALAALKAHRVRQNAERLKWASGGVTSISSFPTPWGDQ